ncbi:MAG: manganese catalase family protein [Blautia sp.]|nr:manganese catalase family protein [Blautia sp.]MCM1200626.1 manganese catalase family protein [Bacteroides fragilis]
MYQKAHRIMLVRGYGKWNITDASLGTEELAHLEIVATIIHQLTKGLSMEEIENSGFANYYVDHTIGIWPQSAGGFPFSAAQFQSTGDIITDLMEDMAAEQKARLTYDNILRLIHDQEVCEPIKFLRAREIVHFQRFGEALRIVQDRLNEKNFYAFNPGFDCNGQKSD